MSKAVIGEYIQGPMTECYVGAIQDTSHYRKKFLL